MTPGFTFTILHAQRLSSKSFLFLPLHKCHDLLEILASPGPLLAEKFRGSKGFWKTHIEQPLKPEESFCETTLCCLDSPYTLQAYPYLHKGPRNSQEILVHQKLTFPENNLVPLRVFIAMMKLHKRPSSPTPVMLLLFKSATHRLYFYSMKQVTVWGWSSRDFWCCDAERDITSSYSNWQLMGRAKGSTWKSITAFVSVCICIA